MLKFTKETTWVKAADLFFISLITLYFEILFIRWLPANVQIVSYFTNLVLISAFLGLGVGCLLADEEKYGLIALFPLSLLTLVIVGICFSLVPISFYSEAEHFLGNYSLSGYNYLVLLLGIFIFNTLFFIILGQELGRALKFFEPLAAYSINIAGSILGVLLFWVLSSLSTGPIVWFVIGGILGIWPLLRLKKGLIIEIPLLVLTLFFVKQFSTDSFWSPYYKVDVIPVLNRTEDKTKELIGFSICVNNTYHQHALDLSENAPEWWKAKNFKRIYEFPYQFMNPREVLVIGAGSGNDVQIALNQGVKSVDAVEIDPFITKLGKYIHPQMPYQNENVNVIVDDARSYLSKSDKKYDLIVFGYLDAHKLVSEFSSVRLDNFIYTVESFEAVKEHLRPDGLLVVTFFTFRDWVAAKVYGQLEDVFGDDLVVFEGNVHHPNDTTIAFAGPFAKNIPRRDFGEFKLVEKYKGAKVPQATDDWPYLYLAKRAIPKHYTVMLSFIFGVSIILIFGLLKEKVRQLKHYQFFFLGAGFMLIETKAITKFALLYGSTWIINTVVITSILCMILLANYVVAKTKISSLKYCYILLVISILLEWGIDKSFFLSFNRILGLVLSSILLALPLFFAGIIFAKLFKQTKDPAGVFAFNLSGAVLGGVLEYSSMIMGFKMLSFIALAMYLASYFSYKKGLR